MCEIFYFLNNSQIRGTYLVNPFSNYKNNNNNEYWLIDEMQSTRQINWHFIVSAYFATAD